MATNFPASADDNDTIDAERVQGSGRKEPHIENLVAAVKAIETNVLLNGAAHTTGAGRPKSGTGSPGAGTTAAPGSYYADTTNGGLWFNAGTLASPYWEPMFRPGEYNSWGVFDDFTHRTGKALADTATSLLLPSGLRVLGDGVHETNSGAVVVEAEGNPYLELTGGASAAGDLAALAVGPVAAAGCYQPDQHGMGILDVKVSHKTAITARLFAAGFAGLIPVGMTDITTIATTVLTLVDDDQFCAIMASTAGDADRIYVAHNKSNEAPSIDATVDTAIDTATDMAAAGVEQRFRVEIDADGRGRVFINKVMVYNVAAQVDVDEELNPFVYSSPSTTTAATLNVFRFMFMAGRVA